MLFSYVNLLPIISTTFIFFVPRKSKFDFYPNMVFDNNTKRKFRDSEILRKK